MDSIRVMVFYDGSYFKQGNVYFRYKEERGWISFEQLHSTLERFVADKLKTSTDITKVVAKHYYDGRTTTEAANQDNLEKDRDFEMALIKAGIIPHYLPVKETPRLNLSTDSRKYDIAQKGVDVQFAIDVLDFAHEDRFDVAVLITGDGDFIPLVHRITSLGKHALIAHFSFEAWTDNRGFAHKPTDANRALLTAASFSLNFNQLVKDSNWRDDVRRIFFTPKPAA